MVNTFWSVERATVPVATPSTVDIVLYAVIGALGSFFLLFFIFVIIVLCLWRRSSKKLRDQIWNLTHVSFKQSHMKNCYCCIGGDMRVQGDAEGDDQEATVSQNGFTREVAREYVDSIEESFKFAQRDNFLREELVKRSHVFVIRTTSTTTAQPQAQPRATPPGLEIMNQQTPVTPV